MQPFYHKAKEPGGFSSGNSLSCSEIHPDNRLSSAEGFFSIGSRASSYYIFVVKFHFLSVGQNTPWSPFIPRYSNYETQRPLQILSRQYLRMLEDNGSARSGLGRFE
jgi:hypothetical protein